VVTTDYVALMQMATAVAAWANGLFFLRFWRESRDALFAFFGAAFWLMALSSGALAVLHGEDSRPYAYALRLLAFLLLILGMVHKNRQERAP
jgi:hypothetical protein